MSAPDTSASLSLLLWSTANETVSSDASSQRPLDREWRGRCALHQRRTGGAALGADGHASLASRLARERRVDHGAVGTHVRAAVGAQPRADAA